MCTMQCSVEIGEAQRGRKSNKTCNCAKKVTINLQTWKLLRVKGDAINCTMPVQQVYTGGVLGELFTL